MDNELTFENAKLIAKQFAYRIFTELDPQAEIYLYGSIATGQNSSTSDIDIAVVSKVFTNDVCNNYALVNYLAFGVNEKIDAQAIIYEDWVNKTPFTLQVQKQGVLITQ